MSQEVEERLARLEDELCELRDREAIRDVLYRYCRAADRLDAELMQSCYHEDARDTHHFFNGGGRDFADYVIGEVLPRAVMSEHVVSNPIIELDGDRAFSECRWNVLHRLPFRDGTLLDQLIHGRYLDIFERRDGVWRISYRHVVVDAYRDIEVPDVPFPPEMLGKHGTDDQVYCGLALEELRPEPHRDEDFWAQFYAMHGVAAPA